jgi:ACS family hexuronate transporter-like MFS transporter
MNPQGIGRYRWTICALLFFATTVNYLDRQVLSLLAPALSKEFGWSNTDYANITAVFQFGYAISMLFAGRFIDAIGTKRAFTIAVAVWSVGAMMHAFSVPIGTALVALGVGLPVSVVGFMVARAVLALGEAGNFPAAIKATAEYFPKKERSFATVPWIAVTWGWQMAFIAIGAIGFLWIVLWSVYYDAPSRQRRLGAQELAYIHGDREAAPADEGTQVPWFRLLAHRQTWAFAIGKFLTDGVWWFYLFWLPKYLTSQYGMTTTDIALPLTVLYSMTMVGSIGGGWFPSYYMQRGYQPYDGRMRAMLVIAFFPLVVLLAQPLGTVSYWMPVLLIGIGASAHQAWSANLFTTVSDMFPKRAIGSVVGIGGMAGGLGGVAVSKLGGWIFDAYGARGQLSTGYMVMFSVCALAYLVAWAAMKALVPRHKEITEL